jgi:hypothetical protein
MREIFAKLLAKAVYQILGKFNLASAPTNASRFIKNKEWLIRTPSGTFPPSVLPKNEHLFGRKMSRTVSAGQYIYRVRRKAPSANSAVARTIMMTFR